MILEVRTDMAAVSEYGRLRCDGQRRGGCIVGIYRLISCHSNSLRKEREENEKRGALIALARFLFR